MNIRSKSNEILHRGQDQRETWRPSVNSTSLKIYHYWASASLGYVPSKENFCHFWRVVLIWAPLVWIVCHTIVPLVNVINKLGPTLGRVAQVLASPLKKIPDNVWIILVCLPVLAIIVALFITSWQATLIGILAVVVVLMTIILIGHVLDRSRERLYSEMDSYDCETYVPRQPGRVKKFFLAIGDIIVLVFQVVRVKKWKICPIVEIPKL